MSRARLRNSRKSVYCLGEMLAKRTCVVVTNALIVASRRDFNGGASTGRSDGWDCLEP